jgi:hypothetical protein
MPRHVLGLSGAGLGAEEPALIEAEWQTHYDHSKSSPLGGEDFGKTNHTLI